MYEVRRTFPSAQPVRLGQTVDPSAWRNKHLLIKQGYLVPVTDGKSGKTVSAPPAEIDPTKAQESAAEPKEEIIFEEEEVVINEKPEAKGAVDTSEKPQPKQSAAKTAPARKTGKK